MKLEQIQMKNFGSFRDAEIDLTAISASVITGGNGAGKSTAFVDAPLAALFGKCRVSLDDIMALGTDDMVLTVVFLLNGQRYRVIRKRSKKTKAGKSELSLQIAQRDGFLVESWEDASGSRIQDTQDKICKLLNADYDLITATGFLLQGSADKFSRATPSERKAILAQILRLDQYGPLKQAATRHLTIADARHSEKAGQLTVLDETASTVASLGARQEEVTLALDDTQKAIEQLGLHQQEVMTKKAALTAELEQLQAIPQQIAEIQTQQSAVLKDHASKTMRRERAAKILENRATIEAKVTEEAQLKQFDILFEEERRKLSAEALEVKKQVLEVRLQVADGVVLEREIVTARAEVDRQVRAYQTETDRLERTIETDERACSLLKQVPCGAELQGRCQFTLQAVEAQRRLPATQDSVWCRYTTGQEDKIAPEASAALNVLVARQSEWIQRGYGQEEKRLNESLTAVSDKQEDCELRRLKIRNGLTELAKFTSLIPELAAAEREVESVDQDLATLMETLNDIDHTLERLQTRQADRARLTTEQERLAADWQQDAIYLARLRTDGQTAIGRLKELEFEIKQAQEAGRQAEQLRQECERLQIDGRHFQALATAYAQIPVLIMESALPMLEEEANRILSKISMSGLRVTVNTQKALKSRDGLAETLDISVRDVFGERMLENFSGGERARVDLAIRIGLSKLLANRAGAKLETLVVDEAFAAVDREGVEQLVECLPMLSAEFPLILFITHDEGFKSSIAQQILVTKDGSGSHVDLIA